MSQVVIVAIPAKDDYVWQISSDKVPHMTLMNLGDQVSDASAIKITRYLDHVVRTSMQRFGMDVLRRGTLGVKEADVLFFGRHNSKMLETIRGYFLTNPEIYKAYHSTPQFEMFTPHLTLGFPDNPAKPDKRDSPGTFWVNFDRIALWTGDFEGPEYELPAQHEMSDLAMGDSVVDFLAHFGVKGMKWGVRRTKTSTSTSDDAQRATEIRSKVKVGGTKALSNRELQDLITRMNLEQQYGRLNPSKFQKGAKVVSDILQLGGTINQAVAIANSPAGKAIRNGLSKK
jgi:2'-5' RNA ligase